MNDKSGLSADSDQRARAIPHARDLIPVLRKEATDVKQCFTTFSFQTFVFSAAVLGAVAAYSAVRPVVNFVPALVSVLVLAVCRIGTYKYATANRNYGFELFIDRLTRLTPDVAGRVTEASLEIGWEEAMRAWRIVQASTFRHLYFHRGPLPNLKSSFNRTKTARASGAWWDVRSLVGEHATYHAGSYLSAMLFLLYLFLFASWLPLASVALAAHNDPTHQLHDVSGYIICGVVSFVLLCSLNVWFIERRRIILESELLSIHSSAIMWEAVVVAHHRALAEVRAHHFNGYTRALALQTESLLKDLADVHAWLVPRHDPPPPVGA
jgi:hypothetical protein